jgi:hypothetical protein
MVFRVAREDGRDAVFNVPAQVMDTAPPDPEIEVFLTLNRNVQAVGRVRGSAPGRPGNRHLEVKVGLLVATMLTLVFLPTVYVTWFRGKEAAADQAAPVPASSTST